MNEAATIPSNYSRLIARALGLLVQDLPKLLAHTNLSVDEFLDESTLITADQQITLLENAFSISGDEAFGLAIGKMLTPAAHGAMGFLVNSSPNLMTALQGFQTFSPTRMSFVSLDLRAEGDWLSVYYHVELDLKPEILRCITEASAITFFDCAEHLLGHPLNSAITSFIHPKPNYNARYSDCIPGEILFSQTHTIVKIPIEACREHNVSANHENYQLAFKQCEQMLSTINSDERSYTYKLQKLMLSHPPGTLSEDDAAAAMFVSKRTLARYLERENSGFRKIRDDILCQQAQDYLRNSRMSVEAIATLLNYHDSSNFRRAFKRWNNQTPDQYRKAAQRIAL